MNKIFTLLLLSVPFMVIGCGNGTEQEIVETEKEKSIIATETIKSDKKLNIQVGNKEDGIKVNFGEDNKSLDLQVGNKEDGVSVKMGENGLNVNIGNKDGGGVSINLGSFFK